MTPFSTFSKAMINNLNNRVLTYVVPGVCVKEKAGHNFPLSTRMGLVVRRE